MAYAAGDSILDDEYNVFVNSSTSPYGYNHFAGTGATVYGLGQTAIPVAVAGEKITAAQWNLLITGMTNIANHTNDTMTATSVAALVAGDPIKVRSAIATDLASLAAEVAGGSTSATAFTTSSALQTSSASAQWYTNHTVEQSVTFTNANTMRWFFNAGGKIRVAVDRTGNGGTGGGATSKDTDWDGIFTSLGNLDINSLTSTRSGSGQTLTTNNLSNGFQDATTSYQTIIKLTADTSPYTSNYIEVFFKCDATGSGGSATKMTVKTDLRDGAADTTFTSGNTSSVDATANRVGVTRVRIYTVQPNDTEGLASTITQSTSAAESNATDG